MSEFKQRSTDENNYGHEAYSPVSPASPDPSDDELYPSGFSDETTPYPSPSWFNDHVNPIGPNNDRFVRIILALQRRNELNLVAEGHAVPDTDDRWGLITRINRQADEQRLDGTARQWIVEASVDAANGFKLISSKMEDINLDHLQLSDERKAEYDFFRDSKGGKANFMLWFGDVVAESGIGRVTLEALKTDLNGKHMREEVDWSLNKLIASLKKRPIAGPHPGFKLHHYSYDQGELNDSNHRLWRVESKIGKVGLIETRNPIADQTLVYGDGRQVKLALFGQYVSLAVPQLMAGGGGEFLNTELNKQAEYKAPHKFMELAVKQDSSEGIAEFNLEAMADEQGPRPGVFPLVWRGLVMASSRTDKRPASLASA